QQTRRGPTCYFFTPFHFLLLSKYFRFSEASFALASLKASIRENFPDTQLSLMILFLNDIYRRFLSITPPKYRRWCSAP
ncbi:MAG: hypothetical protein ACLUTK_03300, partial [[Clostridium] leptum]